MGPYTDYATPEGATVLRTIPGQLLGPGHNSMVVGPDGEDYLVYHAWDPQMTGRRMFLAPMDWHRILNQLQTKSAPNVTGTG